MLFGGTGPQTYGVPGRFQALLRAPEVPRAAFPKPGERGLKSTLPTCSQTIPMEPSWGPPGPFWKPSGPAHEANILEARQVSV